MSRPLLLTRAQVAALWAAAKVLQADPDPREYTLREPLESAVVVLTGWLNDDAAEKRAAERRGQ